MTTRKRFLVTVSAAMLAVGLFAPGAHAKVGNGNSDAAHICQQQGYEELEGDDGTTFSNPGECTGFAARRGPSGELTAIKVRDTGGHECSESC